MKAGTSLISVVAFSFLMGGCQPRAVQDPGMGTSAGRFRVSVWNVAESSFVRRPEIFRRVLEATQADIFSFDEVGEHTTRDQLLGALRGLRGNADTVWPLSWGAGGDYQRTVIASRTPLERVHEFSPLAFPSNTSLILSKAPDSLQTRLRADFARGVATNAAVVEVRGRRLLLVGLDLWARGNSPDSWEEARRRVEAATIRDAMALVVERLQSEHKEVSGILVGGDMNLIAGRAPLDTLLTFAAGRFSGLTLAPAVHADGWSTLDMGRPGRSVPQRSDGRNYLQRSDTECVERARRKLGRFSFRRACGPRPHVSTSSRIVSPPPCSRGVRVALESVTASRKL